MADELIESWTVTKEEHPGWEFRVTVYADPDAGRPEDNGDVYDPNHAVNAGHEAEARRVLDAWRADLWWFVRVMVVPVRVLPSGERMALDGAATHLGATEWGHFPQPDTVAKYIGREAFDTYPVPDLISEALEQVSAEAERLRQALQGL